MASRFLWLFRLVLMATGALLLIVFFTPLVCWAGRPLVMPWTKAKDGVLIVLSGSTVAYTGSPPSRLIGISSYWRTIHAIHVWRESHFQKIVVSGMDSSTTIMPLLIASGIPESAIVIEDRATNTHENVMFSKPILARFDGPYVLLTSDYHMLRAARCFAHENIVVKTLPAPDLFKRCHIMSERLDTFLDLMREFGSLAYYSMRGWI